MVFYLYLLANYYKFLINSNYYKVIIASLIKINFIIFYYESYESDIVAVHFYFSPKYMVNTSLVKYLKNLLLIYLNYLYYSLDNSVGWSYDLIYSQLMDLFYILFY